MSISGIDQSISPILTGLDTVSESSRSEATTQARMPEHATLLEQKTALSLEKLESAYQAVTENQSYANIANLDAAQKEFNSNSYQLMMEARQSGNPEIEAAYERLSDAHMKAYTSFQYKMDEPNRIAAQQRADATKQAEALLPKTQASFEKLQSARAKYAEDQGVNNFLALQEAETELNSNFHAFREQAMQCDSIEIRQAYIGIADEYNQLQASNERSSSDDSSKYVR